MNNISTQLLLKTLTFFKYLPLLLLLLLHVEGWGQGLENFNNSNANSSYRTSSFTGNDGITWSYTASRNENGDANNSGIDGKALMLRRSSDNSKVVSSSISGGIGNFSVKLYKGFTSGGNRQVELFINNISQGTSTPFDNFNEQTFSVNGINISGNFTIEIRNKTSKQVIIDDISWTGFSPSTAPTGVTTGTAGSISAVGAIISGNNITGDGGAAITERGVVYGTSANPTLSNSKQVVAGTTGTFSATLGGLSNSTTYYVRAYATNSVGTTYGSQIDFTTLAPAGSTASDIIENTGFSYTSNINYSSFVNAGPLTSANSLELAQFTIRDGGAGTDADAFSTTLTNLTLSVSNHANLNRIAIFDGTTNIAEVAAGASVSFSSLGLVAADNSTKTFSVRASFNSNVTDNQEIQLTITSATAQAGASLFAAANAGGASSSTTGDRNRIEVTATQLAFVQQPNNTNINEAMSPAVTVEATDANNNRDLDYTSNINITSTGTLTGSPVGVAAVAGLATFSTLTHTADGTGLSLTAASGALTDATSGSFDIVTPVIFEKINSLAELTDGEYIILNKTEAFAMNSAHGDGLFPKTDVTPVSSKIEDPIEAIIWNIVTNGGGRTIQSKNTSEYASYSGSSNNIQSLAAVSSDNQRWTFTFSTNEFVVTNLEIPGRTLRYNTGSPRFVCYESSFGEDLILYKKVVPPTISSSGSLSALSTTYGTASSNTTFSVSGANMAAGILVTPPAGFEVSQSADSGFGATTTVGAAGTIASTTVYVRLAATSSVGSYSGNIVLSSAGATSVNVATVSSSVSAEALTVTASAQTKIEGSTSPTTGTLNTHFTVSGLVNGNTANEVTLAYSGSPAGNLETATPGSYTITPSALTLSSGSTSNYSITYITGTLTISAAASPILNPVTLASALASTYGTASNAVSFAVGGSNLTATITVTPQSGYEIATSSGGAYQSTPMSGVSNDTTLWVRFPSTRAAGTYNYSTAVVLSGGGASSSANVTTSSSGNMVSQKALTVTGLTAQNKTYDGLTTATTTGTAALSGVVGGNVVSLSGTPTFTFDNATVGNSKTVNTTGYSLTGAQAANYTLTQPTLSANITARALTITANNVSKVQGVLLTGGAGSTAFTSSGLQNGESIGSVTIAYGTAGATTGDGNTVGVYASQVTPSAATGGTFTASNYSISYVAGSITVLPTPEKIAGWDFYGLSGYGSSPQSPTNSDANVTIGGLTRASGFGTGGTAAGNAWGGTGNGTATFTIKANSGYTLSLSEISAYNVRRSNTGASTGQWAYSLDGTNFTNIGSTITWGGTSSSGNAQSAISLIGISALQNLSSTTTVTFRIVNSGGSSGTWYLNDFQSGDDFIVQGVVSCPTTSISAHPSMSAASTCLNGTAFSALSVTATGTGLEYQWQQSTNGSTGWDTAVGGSGATTASYTPPNNLAGTLYYRCVITNGCGVATNSNASGERTVNVLPALATASNGSRCGTGTVNIGVTDVPVGTTIDWYAAASGGTVLAGGTGTATFTTPSISTTATYYAQTRNSTTGCVSSSRRAVTASVNTTPAAPTASAQSLCSSATVSDLTATGDSIQWYNASTGGDLLAAETALSSTTYYASQTVSGCESARTSVPVTVNANGTWIGGASGDWNEVSNWCGGLPTSSSSISISSGTTISIDAPSSVLNLTIDEGSTLDFSGSHTLTIADGGSFTNNGTLIAGTGTIEFSGTQTINTGGSGSGKVFHNVIKSGSGTATLAGDMKTSGNVTISGGTFDVSASNYALNVGGDWTNNATFTPRNGTVTFDNTSADQNITGSNSSSFYNLSLSKPGDTLQMLINTNVTNEVQLTSGGILKLNEYSLNLDSTGKLIGESATNYVFCSCPSAQIIASGDILAGSYTDLGNLGLSINPSLAMGQTTVIRTHQPKSLVDGELSIARVYKVTPTVNTNLDASLQFTYFPHEKDDDIHSSLVLFRGEETESDIIWSEIGGTYDTENNKITITDWQHFSPLTAGNGSSSLLPVELLEFKATPISNERIQLHWETATEINNEGFEVQRSTDGISFETIGWVEGNGNSTIMHSYYSDDTEPYSGINYYRLKQVDFDGQYEYSNIVAARIKMGALSHQMIVYPNPASDRVNIDIESSYATITKITISDIAGKQLLVKEINMEQGWNAITLNTAHLVSGVYFISIESKDQPMMQKVVIAR